MRLTVLGKWGSFPALDGACSGYLLEEGGCRLLLDCGNGTMARLQRFCRPEELLGVIISHLHLDHCADLFVLRYALETRRASGEALSPLPVYLPRSPACFSSEAAAGDVFALSFVSEALALHVGPFSVSFARMPHSIESYAVRVESGGKALVYSGDTVMSERLIEFSRRADLLLCEATIADHGGGEQGLPHLSAPQAAKVAAQASAARLLLTHFWYLEDLRAIQAGARKVYPLAELCEELAQYEI